MASRSERYNVELTATDSASEVINQVAEAREKLSDEPVVVDVTADDEATEVIEDVSGKAEELDGTEAEVDLAADDEASEPIGDVSDAVGNLDGAEAEVGLAADDEASDPIGEVADAVGELDGESATVDISVEGDDDSDITDVADAIADLDGESATVDIEVEGDDDSTVTDVADALGELDGESASASLDVEGSSEASGELQGIVDNVGILAAGGLTGLAGAGLQSIFSGAAEHVLEVQGLAEATGDTLENASGIIEAFDFVGVSAAKVQGFVSRVNDKLLEAPELAAQLGITIDENATPLENFVAVVDALNSGQLTANERLSLATEIFGRKGALSVLAIDTQVGNLGKSIENMPEWQVVTEADIESAISFKETMDEIEDLAAETAQQFLTWFAPGLRDFLGFLDGVGDKLNTIASAGQELNAGSVEDWINALPTEKYNEVTQAYIDLGSSIADLSENVFDAQDAMNLLKAGVPPEVIATAELTGGAFDALGQAMAETDATAAALHQAFVDGAVSQQEWNTATADGVITMGEVKSAIGDTDVALAENVTATDEAAQAAADHEAAIKAQEQAINDEIAALEESAQAHKDQAEAVSGAADAWLDQRAAVRDAEAAVDDYHDAMQPVEDDTRTATQVTRDQEEALDRVVESYVRVADGAVEQEKQTRAATGATLSDVDALGIHNQSLLTQAGTLQGAEKQALLEHTLRINGIPEERITTIFTDNDPNDLAQVEAELDNASRTRAALLEAAIDEYAASVAEQRLDTLAATRYATIVANVVGGAGINLFGQHGSPHTTRGRYLVGEAGPEVVEMPEGAMIHPTERTSEMMGGGGAGDTYNQTNIVHLPAGTPSSTVNLFRRYERRNGKLNGVVT